MVQVLLKIIITLAILVFGYFLLHKTWTSEIDILRLFRKPADIIPVKEQGNEDSTSEQIQEKILEETKKHTRLLEQMQHLDKTNHEKLIRDYPLGYLLFAIKSGDEILTQSTNQLQKEWKVDWNSAKIIEIDEKQITLMPPGLYAKDGKRAIAGNIIGISRREGSFRPVLKAFGIELFCGVLVDDSTGIICLIGLKGL